VHGQLNISNAISGLKIKETWGKLIWFGFGIKDVLRELGETERGLTLVGLCAALTATYSSLYAANVAREVFVISGTPEDYIPALRQWRILMDLCSGILTTSAFAHVLITMRSLLSSDSCYLQETHSTATTPTELAKTILTLAQLSKHKYNMPPL